MTDTASPPKRGRGRPPKPYPELIDATPQEVAQSLFNGPPKEEWRFEEAEASDT